jgi:hypothetical protein
MTLNQLLLATAYKLDWLFWPVWGAVVVALVYVAVRTQPCWRSRAPFVWPRVDAVLVLIFLVPYVLFMVWGVAFAYHDNDFFLETAAGRSQPLHIWPEIGRYFPLQMKEFNLLRRISPTALFYQSMVAVQLVLFCGLLLIALADISIRWRVGAVLLLLCSNSIGIVFADPIYPERNIVFAMALFIVAVQRFDRSPSRLNFIAATFAAHLSLYYKEPIFLLVGTFAATRLLLVWWRTRPAGWAWLRGQPFELSLLGVCLVFASQLFLTLLAKGHSQYVADATVGSLTALARYARTDMWLLALIAGLVFRIRRLRALGDVDAIWDPLVHSAVIYFVVLIVLGLFADRYAPPIDLIAALYLAREMAYWWSARPARRWFLAAATAATATAVCVFGAFRLIEHKSVVRGTAELAAFLDRFAAEHPGTVRVHFPDTYGWRLMNFAGYLHYRYPAAYERIHLRGPHAFAENRCAYWRDYRCEHAVAAEPGDLIAHLPDDLKRDGGQQGRLLFEYELIVGGVPYAFGTLLYPGAPLYVGKDMPLGWLKATAALHE